jgi:hypothetical protein
MNEPTKYSVLVWDVKPEDFPHLGCMDRVFNTNSLTEATAIYEGLTDVFTKELYHYYEYETEGWNSCGDCLMSDGGEEE